MHAPTHFLLTHRTFHPSVVEFPFFFYSENNHLIFFSSNQERVNLKKWNVNNTFMTFSSPAHHPHQYKSTWPWCFVGCLSRTLKNNKPQADIYMTLPKRIFVFWKKVRREKKKELKTNVEDISLISHKKKNSFTIYALSFLVSIFCFDINYSIFECFLFQYLFDFVWVIQC